MAMCRTLQVYSQFVKNLMSLRDATSEVIESVRYGISNIPIYMRIAARTAYKLSHTRVPEHSDQSHLSVAGVVVIKDYIANLMQFPENFGYVLQDPIASGGVNPQKTAENLKYLSRVLLQVFSMKAFSDNFMKPLNDYVVSCTESTKSIIRK